MMEVEHFKVYTSRPPGVCVHV